MARPSNREERRRDIIAAFARALAEHGYAGATVAAIADEAELSPGLIHHHFDSKDELLTVLMDDLIRRFRASIVSRQDAGEGALMAYIDAALKLDAGSDLVAARCWVGLFAEAIRNPSLFKRMRRLFAGEIESIERRAKGELSAEDAGAALSFIVGSLVVGSFAPRKTAGFAAPALKRFVGG